MDFPAHGFFKNRGRISFDSILHYLDKLNPDGEDDDVVNDTPWIECCIMSYTTTDTGICYQIFDTEMFLQQ